MSPSTLKVYLAAIAAHHHTVDGQTLGKHDLIVSFLRGARRMNPSRSPLMPSWDLSIILAGLQRGPFEPLDSVKLKFLSDKTALLLRFKSSEQLFVCHGGQQKVKAPWIVDAIALAYQSQGEPCPPGVRTQSTQSVVSSYVLAHGASLADICRAGRRAGRHRTPSAELASWATLNTFARFYSLRIEPISSRVLGKQVMGGKNWPVSRLLRHSPSSRDASAFFLLQLSSPDGKPWLSSSSTPGSQTGWSSLTPGPVLVLAHPGPRSAPVLGLVSIWPDSPSGKIPYVHSSTIRFPLW